jgi:hypothetical protein
MTERCSCGFSEAADEELIDHLLEAFAAEDGTGDDGQVHDETRILTCSCGFTARTTREMDEHFLKIFAPADSIGRDGTRHVPAETE